MFEKISNPRLKLFLQDDYSSQNSVKARSAWDEVDARKFTIPLRSPDLNIFHIDKDRFLEKALDLRKYFFKCQDYTGIDAY